MMSLQNYMMGVLDSDAVATSFAIDSILRRHIKSRLFVNVYLQPCPVTFWQFPGRVRTRLIPYHAFSVALTLQVRLR